MNDIPILVLGKSGTGKSTSIEGLDPKKVSIINVLGKPLPFRGSSQYPSYTTDDYAKVESAIALAKTPIVVIDDASYLMTAMFMKSHASAGAGNGVFMLYNQIGDHFWHLIEEAKAGKNGRRIYMMMHEEMTDLGFIKPKTIGKMLDEKVCVEGMFSIVLRCIYHDGQHVFRTQTDGMDVAKSPKGMFKDLEIPNDLAIVDKAICEYYDIKEGE